MSFEGEHIIDTSVLSNFLLVGGADLLMKLLGTPLQVPLAVYDSDEIGKRHQAGSLGEGLSEIGKGILHFTHRQREDGNGLAEDLERISEVDLLYNSGQLVTIELMSEERDLFIALNTGAAMAEFGFRGVIGAGESACIAIAYFRRWTIATDDNLAHKVMRQLSGGDYSYERTRKLLVRAADENLISKSEANRLHSEIVNKGFWDKELPFPKEV